MKTSSIPTCMSLAFNSGILFLFIALCFLIVLGGCKTMEAMTNMGMTFGVATGTIDQARAESIKKSSMAVARTFRDITPEQEYYIGRTVGAVIVNRYKPYNNPEANRYLNLLGQTLAQASDLPETFGGYHFLILDSDEINAFAAAGGLVFVTRGMLGNCRNEDALAAVLAHEIGHVQLRHGLQAIKKASITTALTTLALEGAKTFSGKDFANLMGAFEGSIADITATMINNGYSRSFEQQADKAAVAILQRGGYNPNGLVDMLRVMQDRLKPDGFDFAKTHPAPVSRIADIQKSIGPYKVINTPASRQSRFMAFLGGI